MIRHETRDCGTRDEAYVSCHASLSLASFMQTKFAHLLKNLSFHNLPMPAFGRAYTFKYAHGLQFVDMILDRSN